MKDNEMKNCLSKRYSKNNAMSKIFSDKQYIDRFSSLMKQKKKKNKKKETGTKKNCACILDATIFYHIGTWLSSSTQHIILNMMMINFLDQTNAVV